MGWAVVFLALLTYCTGINAQSAWTQPPSSSVSPGGTVTISCTTQSTNTIGWNQQKAGEAPRFVHCKSCNRGEGIPNRFTATQSGTTGSLTITNAEAGDEADYYCVSWNGAVNELHVERRRGGKGEIHSLERRDWPIELPTMSQAFLVSILLISFGPSLQQLRNLKDPEFVTPGGTVTISCRYDGGNLGDGNYPWWSQQFPGDKPRALIYTTSSRPSGVPARFSGSRSGNVMSLTITGALVEDEATYYCCVWTGSQSHSD
ncbi:immunoglobulin iota chain-like [Thamnophis elegans]|uniref:immunoglobulin iota chain-like n=1 Tax=Thamnophis elegans TaxID=35005 RepID=UPI0013782B8E|nr:immunoglobulin iota chain-like [Thamnophis elegans]